MLFDEQNGSDRVVFMRKYKVPTDWEMSSKKDL